MLEQVTNVWEYGKAAAIHNLGNEWWDVACPVVKANPGVFLPLPPVSLAEQMRARTYKSEACETLAVQMEALYLAMAAEPSRANVYFKLNPVLDPLEERWKAVCD